MHRANALLLLMLVLLPSLIRWVFKIHRVLSTLVRMGMDNRRVWAWMPGTLTNGSYTWNQSLTNCTT